MRLNEHQAILTPKLLLVPYSEHHVPTYHEWMQDEELQKATASEPLTLEEEYAMQKSWRTDADKLTFIVCTTTPAPTSSALINSASSDTIPQEKTVRLQAGKEDSPETMIGDINLFLYPDDDDDDDDDANQEEKSQYGKETNGGIIQTNGTTTTTPTTMRETKVQNVLGEVEIMIASHAHQGKGLGRAVLLAFLWYVVSHAEGIMREYDGESTGDDSSTGDGKSHGNGENSSSIRSRRKSRLTHLRVKIDADNARSIKLFESAGFARVSETPNYFGELEFRRVVGARALEDVEREMGGGAGGVPVVVEYSGVEEVRLLN